MTIGPLLLNARAKWRGRFAMARGVRHGCLASGVFTHDADIPRNPSLPACLQPAPCAYADDFPIAAPSFRTLMPTIALPFLFIDRVTGMNPNYKKRHWVRYGNEACDNLHNWVVDNCSDFSETNITRVAKHVGTMIGLDYLHRWTAPRNKFVMFCKRINQTSKSLVERLIDYKIFAVSEQSFIGSVTAPDEANLEESHALQCFAVGSYNATSTPMLMAGSERGSGIDVHGIHIISLAARFTTATRSGTLADGLAKSQAARSTDKVTHHAFSMAWEREMLYRSMAYSTLKTFKFACRMDRSSSVLGFFPHKMQRSVTTWLVEIKQQRVFHDKLLSEPKVFGPINRHRIAHVLPAIRCASRATRPGMDVEIIRMM